MKSILFNFAFVTFHNASSFMLFIAESSRQSRNGKVLNVALISELLYGFSAPKILAQFEEGQTLSD